MRSLFILVFIVCPLLSQGQNEKKTESITIKGRIINPVTVSVDDLKKFTEKTIGDVAVTNHKGEAKGTAKGMKGVLISEVLTSLIKLDTDNPKLFSEYYFVFSASDGYKVVFSWNELFNTATGDNTFLVTVKDNKPATESAENILLIVPTDTKTGRRHVKNLESITVYRAE